MAAVSKIRQSSGQVHFFQQCEHIILVFRPGKYIFGVAGMVNNNFRNVVAAYVIKRMRVSEPDKKENQNNENT